MSVDLTGIVAVVETFEVVRSVLITDGFKKWYIALVQPAVTVFVEAGYPRKKYRIKIWMFPSISIVIGYLVLCLLGAVHIVRKITNQRQLQNSPLVYFSQLET